MLTAVVFISGSFLEAMSQGFPIQPIPFATIIARLVLCVSHADFRQSADLIHLAGLEGMPGKHKQTLPVPLEPMPQPNL